MEAEDNVHCMNAGDGENSYANNSHLQETIISKAKPLLDETIRSMFTTNLPACFKLADVGCSSGPNALLVVAEVMDTINELYRIFHCEKQPEIQVFLNDLPGNDFNNLFKLLPPFYQKFHGESRPCFVAGVPGSFYGRLFPSRSMHLFHASYSLQWLSKVPEGLENNKGNICIARSSPPDVFEAYLCQFERDFSLFLTSRAEELLPGGRIVFTIMSRRCKIPSPASTDCCYHIELLSKSFIDLIASGLVKQEDLDSFNVPFYAPCEGELREIIGQEGSFRLDKLEFFEANWDPDYREDDEEYIFDKHRSGEKVANYMRAAAEPLFASHFGGNIMDELFKRYATLVADEMCVEKMKYFNIAITLTKK